jgi:hypothetical protein
MQEREMMNMRGAQMRELTMNEFSMRELTSSEVEQVSGGWSILGAGLALAGTLAVIAGIVIGTVGAPFWVVIAGAVGIAGAALGGLAYAADALTEYQQSTPHGTVTIEELTPTEQAQTLSMVETNGTLGQVGDLTDAINATIGDMPTIDIEVDDYFGEGGS